jgi:DNA-binding CsgD family transcriptional regulator/PAS domain-containing protein
MTAVEGFVSRIYDCAANPELWPETLTAIRDHLDAAYVMVGVTDIAPLLRGEVPNTVFKNSPWDTTQLATVGRHIHTMPGYHSLFRADIDQAWVQMWECSEQDFRASEFYRAWVAPQKLRDCINVPFFRRPITAGLITAASYDGRALFNEEDANFLIELAPHLRRTLAISDMVDRGRLAIALFRRVLDTLTTAIFIVAQGQRIEFANEAAETILSEGKLLRRSQGALTTARPGPSAEALDDALIRAAQGEKALGIKGIGVPLMCATGERAAAYVLPLAGTDLRAAMGNGYCAVFVAQRGEQLPMTIEVLRTVYDLTQSEARIAALIAKGDSPEAIAEALAIAVSTVRSHIKGALAKTGTHTQAALAACIHELVPPVADAAPS